MGSLPELVRSERLDLAAWTPGDALALRAVLDENLAHLRPWIPFAQSEPRTLAETRDNLTQYAADFAADRHHRVALRERATGELVGEAMLLGRGPDGTREAGYWLAKVHCGMGYATEAIAALLPFAFEALGALAVRLRCDVRNAPSLAVARRLGAVQVDVEALVEDGAAVTLAVLEIERPRT